MENPEGPRRQGREDRRADGFRDESKAIDSLGTYV